MVFIVKRFLLRRVATTQKQFSFNHDKNISSSDNQEALAEEAYLLWLDDPDPDKGEYYKYIIVEVEYGPRTRSPNHTQTAKSR